MAQLRIRSLFIIGVLVLCTATALYFSQSDLEDSGVLTYPKSQGLPNQVAEVPIYHDSPPSDNVDASSTPISHPPPAPESPTFALADPELQQEDTTTKPVPEPDTEKKPEPIRPKYKPEPASTLHPVIDNFPLAAAAHSASELPPIPPWSKPPNPHVPEQTPLFIGFTRNWRLLQQTVVSYITAGWPPEDIYVIENTGTMRSNELDLLSLQNPFYLNHTRLHMFGVNVIATPTLLSFSQLQNFYIYTALQHNWTTYFYGHMDVIALPHEDRFVPGFSGGHDSYKTIYSQAVDVLRLALSGAPDHANNPNKPWAARFFSYDRLALVNREAYEAIGAWDTAILYYNSDCDMHDRLKMYGYDYNEDDVDIGHFYDISATLDDLLVLYRVKESPHATWQPPDEDDKEPSRSNNIPTFPQSWTPDTIGSGSFEQLRRTAGELEKWKSDKGVNGRNTWQSELRGGKGEPYYRDPEGFETSIQMLTNAGRQIYAEKWGHQSCVLLPFGLKAGDEWRVEHDWE